MHFSEMNKISISTKQNLCLALTIIIALSQGYRGVLLSVVLLVFYLFLFDTPEFLLGPLLFFTVFDDYLFVLSGQSYSRFLSLILIVLCFLKEQRGGEYLLIKHAGFSVAILFAFFLSAILSLYASYGYRSIPLTFFLNLLLAFMIGNYRATDTERITEYVMWYCYLSVAFTAFLYIRNGVSLTKMSGRLAIAENVNVNQTAMGLAAVSIWMIGRILFSKKRKTLFDIVGIGTGILCLVLTGSRSALLAAIIATGILIILYGLKRNKFSTVFGIFAVGAVICVCVIIFIRIKHPDLLNRFSLESIIASGGTHRIDIWTAYLKYIFPDHWIIGTGFDPRNTRDALLELSMNYSGVHNIVLEVLSLSGVLGLVFFGSLFFSVLRSALKGVREKKWIMQPAGMMLCVLLNGIGENTLTVRLLWISIGFIYLIRDSPSKGFEIKNEK